MSKVKQKGKKANADNGSCKEMYQYIKKNKTQSNVQNKIMGNGQIVGTYGWKLLGIVSPHHFITLIRKKK